MGDTLTLHLNELKELKKRKKRTTNERIILGYALFISLFLLAAVPIAVFYTKEWNFFENLLQILFSPSRLLTDYFALGGLGSTLFNAAVCGLLTNIIIYLCNVHANATTFAGYMLVIAHAFYGLNFINMWPPFIGVLLYCIIMRKKISENIHIAFFATALAPFVSELLFRYTVKNFNLSTPQTTWAGVILAIVCGIAIGFAVLPLLPATTTIHRGYSLYKAGLAIGILGIFIYGFMYSALGKSTPEDIIITNPAYFALPYAYRGFMNIFFIILFTATFIFGLLMSRKRLKDYGKLLKCTGYGTDFTDKFGMPICMINIAIYGFCIIAYLNLVFILPEIFPQLPAGVGFTGPTAGIVFAAITFAADGQHIRNVFPIVLGYVLLFAIVVIICSVAGVAIPWSLSTQTYINALAFATGLCPIAGKYGIRYGILAGLLSAMICAITADMHGGFVLYNSGFTAGLAALVLIPMLDFYKVKPLHDDDI